VERIAELDMGLVGVVFIASFLVDALGAYYVRTAARGEAFKATAASILIAALGYISLAAFIGNPAYAAPEILGGALGTFLVVKSEGRQKVTK
jgi:hypothetical protein